MKLVKTIGGNLHVIDTHRRVVRLSGPLNELEDMFHIEWLNQTEVTLHPNEYLSLTKQASSFKQLKHYTAKFMMKDIPMRYIKSYIDYVDNNGR